MKNNGSVPKLAEIVHFDERGETTGVNWDRFKKLKDRHQGYFIYYLTRKNILVRLDRGTEAFVIYKEDNGKRYNLNPSKEEVAEEIKYGFSSKEDALEYAKAVYPRNKLDIVIDRYKLVERKYEDEEIEVDFFGN